jgi:hypothetical protein
MHLYFLRIIGKIIEVACVLNANCGCICCNIINYVHGLEKKYINYYSSIVYKI